MPSVHFKAGDEIRDADGQLLMTFATDYTAMIGGHYPMANQVILPNGEHPIVGEQADPAIFRIIEGMMKNG